MDHEKHRSRVRPLSPEGTVHPDPSSTRAPRGIIAIAAGLVVLTLVFVVFGAGGDEPKGGEPPEALVASDAGDLAVTTTTLPPRLADSLPIEMERLSVIVAADDPKVVLWGPSERFARSYLLPFTPRSASFDADGTSIAFIDTRSALFIGPAPGDAAVQIEAMATAVRFHPTDTGELAYTTSIDAPTRIGLYRARAAPGLLGGIDSAQVADVPGTGRLLTWGDWGYALALDEPPAVLILDPDGHPERVMAGSAYTAGGDAILVDSTETTPGDSAALAAIAPIVVDPQPVVGIFNSAFEPIFLFPGIDAASSNVTISPDGSQIAVTTFTNTGTTSVTIRDRSESAPRTFQIDSVSQPIGFVAEGTHLALQDVESRELIVANWRTGVSYRVPAMSGDFLAIHF